MNPTRTAFSDRRVASRGDTMGIVCLSLAVALAACGRMDAIVTLTLPDGHDVILARQTRVPGHREFTTEINLGNMYYASGPGVALGQLVEADGCLRVGAGEDGGFVVIWPKDFTLHLDGEQLVVLDEAGSVAVGVGQWFSSTGADRRSASGLSRFMPGTQASELKGKCGPPYWVVLDQIQVQEFAP